jgi:hypothetical protein
MTRVDNAGRFGEPAIGADVLLVSLIGIDALS